METSPAVLKKIANQLRILSIEATTRAGSGHPSSCCSAADLVSTLFFSKMKFDPEHPRSLSNDRFVLSKGHAAPLLYAAWAETGHVRVDDILKLRQVDSPFEGHPTPLLDFVDVATGSLGQGLSAGLGMAIGNQMNGANTNVYVLMGDGELAEGSVWEAASLAGTRSMEHLIAIVDANRLGQSQATAFGEDIEVYRSRFEAFGWAAVSIDGHDFGDIQGALDRVGQTKGKPLAIVAHTIKGKGIPLIEGKEGWHGKILNRMQADEAIAQLRPNAVSADQTFEVNPPDSRVKPRQRARKTGGGSLDYDRTKDVSTRKAFGNALKRMGEDDSTLVGLDGDTENSTFSDEFGKKFPDRFVECFIAEQNMVGVACGLAVVGKTPVASTFSCFLTRAYDQIRMAAISRSNLKLVGTHTGVSIGEDGASQMGLEDIAMMRAIAGARVFSPSDAISTERIFETLTRDSGLDYMRVARPDTPLLYSAEEKFEIEGPAGGAKVLRQSAADRVTIAATGVVVHEALKACAELAKEGIGVTVIDVYCIKPLGKEVISKAALATDGRVISVEDHSINGGLGDAIAGELSEGGIRLSKLGIREVPHSGKMRELLAKYRVDSTAIVAEVKRRIESIRIKAA